MMTAIYLWLKLTAIVHPYIPDDVVASLCETVGPRLDGTMVTICNGAVMSVSIPRVAP
jgi:hypothetical protein